MRTLPEIEAALHALGWTIVGPTRTSGGYKATIQRGSVSALATGSTEAGVLEDLLRAAESRARRSS